MRARLTILLLAAAGGCVPNLGPQPGAVPVPAPINLQLPARIALHPFTGTRVFSEAGGITGVDVRIEARDHWDDATKAFGQFRFELYHFRATSADPRGDRVAVWNVDVLDPQANRRHWNNISKTYQFKLGWNEPIPIGQHFVLEAFFQSPFGPRLEDRQVFISGQ